MGAVTAQLTCRCCHACALRTPFDFKALWTLDLARSARRAAWRRIYVGGKNENQSLRIRGIEPRSVPWEGTMIPLHQMRLIDLRVFVNNFVLTAPPTNQHYHQILNYTILKKKEKKNQTLNF